MGKEILEPTDLDDEQWVYVWNIRKGGEDRKETWNLGFWGIMLLIFPYLFLFRYGGLVLGSLLDVRDMDFLMMKVGFVWWISVCMAIPILKKFLFAYTNTEELAQKWLLARQERERWCAVLHAHEDEEKEFRMISAHIKWMDEVLERIYRRLRKEHEVSNLHSGYIKDLIEYERSVPEKRIGEELHNATEMQTWDEFYSEAMREVDQLLTSRPGDHFLPEITTEAEQATEEQGEKAPTKVEA